MDLERITPDKEDEFDNISPRDSDGLEKISPDRNETLERLSPDFDKDIRNSPQGELELEKISPDLDSHLESLGKDTGLERISPDADAVLDKESPHKDLELERITPDRFDELERITPDKFELDRESPEKGANTDLEPITPERNNTQLDPVTPERNNIQLDPITPDRNNSQLDPISPERNNSQTDLVTPEQNSTQLDPITPERQTTHLDPVTPERNTIQLKLLTPAQINSNHNQLDSLTPERSPPKEKSDTSGYTQMEVSTESNNEAVNDEMDKEKSPMKDFIVLDSYESENKVEQSQDNQSNQIKKNKSEDISKAKDVPEKRPHRSNNKKNERSRGQPSSRDRMESRAAKEFNILSEKVKHQMEVQKRRDPEKSRRDIERNKFTRASQDIFKKVESGLVPPGMEMDLDIDIDPMPQRHRLELEYSRKWDEHVGDRREKMPPDFYSNKIKPEIRGNRPFYDMSEFHESYAPHSKSPHKRSRSPQKRRSPKRRSRSSDRRQRSSERRLRSPDRRYRQHRFPERRSRSPEKRIHPGERVSRHSRDLPDIPGINPSKPVHKLSRSPEWLAERRKRGAPSRRELSQERFIQALVQYSGVLTEETPPAPVINTPLPSTNNFPPHIPPPPIIMDAPINNFPPQAFIPPDPFVPPPNVFNLEPPPFDVMPLTEQPLPPLYDQISPNAAPTPEVVGIPLRLNLIPSKEKIISDSNQYHFSPSKEVKEQASSKSDASQPGQSIVPWHRVNDIRSKCNEAIKQLLYLHYPHKLVHKAEHVLPPAITSKYMSPMKRNMEPEFKFTTKKDNHGSVLVSSVISTLGLDHEVLNNSSPKYHSKSLKDSATQTLNYECSKCEEKKLALTNSKGVNTIVIPKTSIKTQVEESELASTKTLFTVNKPNTEPKEEIISLTHMTPAQILIAELTARAKSLQTQVETPQSSVYNQASAYNQSMDQSAQQLRYGGAQTSDNFQWNQNSWGNQQSSEWGNQQSSEWGNSQNNWSQSSGKQEKQWNQRKDGRGNSRRERGGQSSQAFSPDITRKFEDFKRRLN